MNRRFDFVITSPHIQRNTITLETHASNSHFSVTLTIGIP